MTQRTEPFELLIKSISAALKPARGIGREGLEMNWIEALASRLSNLSRSLFDCFDLCCCSPKDLPATTFLDILYDAGFTNIDVPFLSEDRTPLAAHCEQCEPGMFSQDYSDWCEVTSWFLDKGSSPCFTNTPGSLTRWPHLVYYLSLYTRYGLRYSYTFSYEKDAEPWADSCRCFCSDDGCSPASILWRCPGRSLKRWGVADIDLHFHCGKALKSRDGLLRAWLTMSCRSVCQRKVCYYQITQLEIFERLGMTHTCCKSTVSPSTAKEIRLEDKSSLRQLQMFLLFFRRIRHLLSSWSTMNTWKVWWEAVDNFLPPLRPKESCDACCGNVPWSRYKYFDWCDVTEEELATLEVQRENSRLITWTKTLKPAGYKDWDYEYVIRLELGKLKERARAWRQRQVARKRRRLVGRPRLKLL